VNRIAVLALLFACSAHAQISPRAADAIIPVAGSTRGQSNANFKTELQMTNPTASAIGGWLLYRPHGLLHRYDIPVHGTLSYDDVIAAMGGSGLGSLDVLADRGVVPVIVARAYDDQPTGTTGVTVPALLTAQVLIREQTGALIAPRDLTRYRFNVGVRTLESGTTLLVIVRNAGGAERRRFEVTYAPNHFHQQSGDAFAGIALHASDSIQFRIEAGSAILYATTVDNVTNDSSMQLMRR
jgi:hypothetical protein